jgi:signal transduction histidine kinase
MNICAHSTLVLFTTVFLALISQPQSVRKILVLHMEGFRLASNMVVANLSGEQKPVNQYVVEWGQPAKWNIPEGKLSAKTIVMYGEFITWTGYEKYILIGVALLLFQVGFVVSLIAQMRRSRRTDLAIRRLTRKLIKASEDERRHLARELHDDIGQRLSLVAIQLSSLNRHLAADDSDSDSDLKDSLRELDILISDVHNLSHSLHSSKLEHLGLGAALKEMCQQIAQRHDLQIDLDPKDVPTDLRPDVALCFYRVAQEALNNAVKHSCATRISVRLTIENELLRMWVKDSGIGFDTTTAPIGLGLATMEERLLTVGGKFTIQSKAGEGTTVLAEAPVRTQNFKD